MNYTHFILRADEPFRGSVQSVLMENGTVAYSDGLTLEQYQAEKGFPVRAIDRDELDRLTTEYIAGLISEPVAITEDRFHEMLNVLPPSRWHNCGGFEVFHVCERITHDLVSWFAHRNGQHWTFNDRAGISDIDLTAKLAAAEEKKT